MQADQAMARSVLSQKWKNLPPFLEEVLRFAFEGDCQRKADALATAALVEETRLGHNVDLTKVQSRYYTYLEWQSCEYYRRIAQ